MKKLTLNVVLTVTAVLYSMFPVSGFALDVNLTSTRPYVEVNVKGNTIRIERNQDKKHQISGFFAKTSRPCPPFCIHPIQADPAVDTVGEVEVFDFLANEVRRGSGLLVDARTADWYTKRTIPGAVNIPWTVLSEADPANPEFLRILDTLGVSKNKSGESLLDKFKGLFNESPDISKWDFTDARELILFCNGPWCDQSPRAIRGLLNIAYPSEKLHYYRGGMNMWEMFGLTTISGM
jgi:rhodanese-related sulfurtransferase